MDIFIRLIIVIGVFLLSLVCIVGVDCFLIFVLKCNKEDDLMISVAVYNGIIASIFLCSMIMDVIDSMWGIWYDYMCRSKILCKENR